MTQQEFQNRVQMTVSPDEYWAINEVYNNSDLDKDAFCRAWVQMNRNRVKKAREEAKAQQEVMKKREKVWKLFGKHESLSYQLTLEHACHFFTKGEIVFLRGIGICTEGRLSDVRFAMWRFLKMV